ncbi:hypothetical protein DPEC_G00087960 [Dallia pectoralis]|uniref:Uncharacterized protein n=1 Tax=Dallia pectoralis TaxID=75939 RepID=A0ACC2H0E9_DALPE|nr:hypothetical protein DPEC_G00087960 [Dallia pectoralis]
MVPEYLDKTSSERRIMEIARTIRSSTAKVVLLIMKPELVASLFMEMIRTNTSRIWIASDAWSTNRILAHMDGINKVGDIFGITFVGGKIPGFDQYLRNLRPSPGGFNRFMEEYKMLRFNCTPELQEYQDCLTQSSPSSCTKPDVPPMKSEQACSGLNPEEADDDYLTEEFELNEAYKERVGTYALAYAIRTLLKCNATSCPGDKAFPPWKLLQVLKNVSFILDNQTISFNENGDMNDGYDLVMWTKHKETRHFEGIGRYLISENKLSINLPTHNNTVPQSRCSDSCTAGFKKNVLNVSCCYNCVKCLAGTFSNSSDQQDCQQCQKGTWSEDGSTQCQRIQEIYLRWSDGHPIALVTSAVLGEVLLLVILIVFLLNKESPPMKRAEVKMSCVMMAGLAVSFASVICFIGRPNDALCQARQTMYGIGFALCVSCILVKSFRIFLAFLACDPEKQHRLDKIYKPTANIITLTSLQVVICALWLIFDFPKVADTPKISLNILHQCDVGAKFIGFGIMLSYIALLAFVGFVLAFKGRKVPQEFSETGYIIFSMLMYLFVWVCFIPIYIMKSEQSATIQASAILVSSYGIVFCHFLPKCYDVALLRTEKGGKIRERMSKMLHMRFRHIDIVHIDVGVSN